jgi:hypothetical protein
MSAVYGNGFPCIYNPRHSTTLWLILMKIEDQAITAAKLRLQEAEKALKDAKDDLEMEKRIDSTRSDGSMAQDSRHERMLQDAKDKAFMAQRERDDAEKALGRLQPSPTIEP